MIRKFILSQFMAFAILAIVVGVNLLSALIHFLFGPWIFLLVAWAVISAGTLYVLKD